MILVLLSFTFLFLSHISYQFFLIYLKSQLDNISLFLLLLLFFGEKRYDISLKYMLLFSF